MILSVAAALSLLGVVVWTLGYLLELPGVATVGAVLVLGVGAMITTDDLRYQSGELEYENADNETVTEFQYTGVETPTRLPIGGLLMLAGALLTIRSFDALQGG